MIEITCIECGHKFDKYTGDMDERTCLTCVLKEEDPDVIKSDNVSYAEDIDQQAFAQGRQSSFTMDNKTYVQLELIILNELKPVIKKVRDNYILVNDRINELLERIVVIEKEIRE